MQYIILAPANAETGRVEDLHQLYRGLKLAGQQVKMAYINNCAINSLKEWAPKQFTCRPSIPLRYSYCGPFELADDIPDTAHWNISGAITTVSAESGISSATPNLQSDV